MGLHFFGVLISLMDIIYIARYGMILECINSQAAVFNQLFIFNF